MPLDLLFIRVSDEDYKYYFQKWTDRLKGCIQVDDEYFEGQSKPKIILTFEVKEKQ